MIKKTFGKLAIALALASGSVLVTTGPAQAASGDDLCYQPYIRELGGWQSWQCNGAWAGTTGRALSIIAINFKTSAGEVCLMAHRSSYGWDSRYQCIKPGQVKTLGAVGTTPIEAVAFYQRNPHGGYIVGGAHSRGIGWTDPWDTHIYATGYSEIYYIGTTGRAAPMEALWMRWT